MATKSAKVKPVVKSKNTKTAAKTTAKPLSLNSKGAKPAQPKATIVTAKPVPAPKAVKVVFKVADRIVYPGHGVGKINAIKVRTVAGTEQQFLDITIIESGMRAMVPVFQAESVGLRKVVDKKAIDRVYTILKDRNFKIDSQTWNRRFREYTQKIKTGSVYEIAEVIRDLCVLKIDKELSFGEKRMLDVAQNLLVSEIAIAKARPQEKVMDELRELFN